MMNNLHIFALSESAPLGERIANSLDVPLSEHEERSFEDGEHKIRPLENVRNKEVFVIQSLYSDAKFSVNDKLCRLLFFIGALKDASAASVTAVLPYLCYARKECKTKSRDPVTTRYLAQMIESVGTDRIVALDVHNPAAFQNAFRCATDHLEARKVLVEHVAPLIKDYSAVVVSPDEGGIKRAERFRIELARRLGKEVGSAFLEKYRSGGEVSGQAVVGDIEGKFVVIVDDLISTGSTIERAAQGCRQHNAAHVYAVATHGLFVGGAEKILDSDVLDQVIVTNTVPPFRLSAGASHQKLTVLDAAPLFASAIRCIHSGDALIELIDNM